MATYKNPRVGQPLITTISSECKTPWLEVKFCNLVKPFYYPNSPTVPRYSVTCIVDPEVHSQFLLGIQTIEKNEDVETIIKLENVKQKDKICLSGNFLIKFQNKDQVPVYLVTDENINFKNPENLLELQDELEAKERVLVVYDILRYTKRGVASCQHGLSFKPTKIFLKKAMNGNN